MQSPSEPLPRHKDKEQGQEGGEEEPPAPDDKGALGEEGADVGLAHAREGHKCVFAEAGEGHDGVEAVLVCGEKVDADCEREEDLLRVLVICLKIKTHDERGETYPCAGMAGII